jgi:nitrite reductase/ring-hydroxylating ferredoxin subunit
MSDDHDRPAPEVGTALPRRTVLAVGAFGAAGAALAACGGSSSSGAAASSGAAGASASAAASGAPLAAAGPASEVPVGGAVIVPVGDTAYVVAQPSAGTYVAHSAVCPHQGCLCNAVTSGKAVCPCHGSEFNAETGAVEKGPAKEGLAPASVSVAQGTLMLPS